MDSRIGLSPALASSNASADHGRQRISAARFGLGEKWNSLTTPGYDRPHRVHRAVAVADLQRAEDGPADEHLGVEDGARHGAAPGESGGDRRAERAPAAVRVARVDALAGEPRHLDAVEEHVVRVVPGVPALDDGGPAPERDQVDGGLLALVSRRD